MMQRETGETLFSKEALEKNFGLSSSEDIEGFVMYGFDASQRNTLALVLGSFDPNPIKAALENESGYREETHGEHEILLREAPLDRNGPFGPVEILAFHSRGIAVGAELDRVKQALDVLDGKAEASEPFDTGDPLRDAIEAPFLSLYANLVPLREDIENGGITQLINTIRFVAGEQEERLVGHLIATASSAEEADRLKNTIEGLMAFARLSQGRDEAFPAWLQELTVQREENSDRVRITLSLPITEETLSQIAGQITTTP
ncbi:MAG: hypothetical protein WD490_10070 [Opitutales bacterium]